MEIKLIAHRNYKKNPLHIQILEYATHTEIPEFYRLPPKLSFVPNFFRFLINPSPFLSFILYFYRLFPMLSQLLIKGFGGWGRRSGTLERNSIGTKFHTAGRKIYKIYKQKNLKLHMQFGGVLCLITIILF